MRILVLNAGSSSLKYKLFDHSGAGEAQIAAGEVDAEPDTFRRAAGNVLTALAPQGIDALAHRVVHGGPSFSAPTMITPEVVEQLDALRPLDPLHNPSELDVIRAGLERLPDAPAVAVFDTAFHATLPEVAWRYALPRGEADRLGLRRYGFHGISYASVAARLPALTGRPVAGSRAIVCHLGNGASVCAVSSGRSVDTSMGMTPLEGLVMGTRCGDIDPGLLLYLLSGRHDAASLSKLLREESGLRGVSGVSNDVRTIEQAAEAGNEAAESALALFCYRVRKYIGAYAAALGGVDVLVFTGGIGQHSASLRARICDGLEFLGIGIDPARNAGAGGSVDAPIGADGARVPVWVMPADEEVEIAREASRLLVARGR